MLCTFQLCTFCVPLCTYSMIEKRFFHALYFKNGFYRHIERNLRLKKGMDCQNWIRRYRYVLHFSIKCSKFRHFAIIRQNSHFPCSNQIPPTIFEIVSKFYIRISGENIVFQKRARDRKIRHKHTDYPGGLCNSRGAVGCARLVRMLM